MVAALEYARALGEIGDPDARRWFEESLLIADAIAAPANFRLIAEMLFAEWLKSQGLVEEAFDILENSVGGATAEGESWMLATLEFVELAHQLGRTPDRTLLAKLEHALDGVPEIEDRVMLRTRTLIPFAELGWREAALVQARSILPELAGVPDVAKRAVAASLTAEILCHAFPDEANRALDPVWDSVDEIADPMVAYLMARSRVRVQITSLQLENLMPLIERMMALIEEAGDAMEFAVAAGLATSALVELDRPQDAVAMMERALSVVTPAFPDRLRALIFGQVADVLRWVGREQEAAEWLERSAQALTSSTSPRLAGFIELHRAGVYVREDDDVRAWEAMFRAAEHIFTDLGQNPFLDGLAGESRVYDSFFRRGIETAERLLQSAGDERRRVYEQLLTLLDSAKCIATREGLRRQSAHPSAPSKRDPWRASGVLPSWARDAAGHAHAVRGLMRVHEPRPKRPLPLRIPSALDELTFRFPDLSSLRFDAPTLLLNFFFTGDDLVVAPFLIDGEKRVALPRRGPSMRIRGCRPALDALAREHAAMNRRIVEDFGSTDVILSPPDALALASGDLASTYRRVFEGAGGTAWMDVLRAESVGARDHHLVVLPDGVLYDFPLHACPIESDSGSRLGDLFASVSYATSLRALGLQQDVVRRQSGGPLRGVLMATPGSDLPGVAREVAALAQATGADRWWIHGDDVGDGEPTYAHFLRRHGAGNLLWLAGHGGAADGSGSDGGFQLLDSALDLAKLLSDPFDFTSNELIVLNACWMGAMPAAGLSHEVTAFNTILPVRGASRVTSALWAVDDRAAVVFADAYIRALVAHCFDARERKPFAYALALRDAVTALRVADRGMFDHEFFWAPWVMYGSG